MMDDCVVFVRFQGRRDGEVRRGVSVEDVNQFCFLHGTNHDTTPLGIRGQILPRDNSPRAGLPERLLVHLDESARLGIVVKDDYAPRVGPYDHII